MSTIVGVAAGAILFALFAFAERGLKRCSRGSCPGEEVHGCSGCGTPWFTREDDHAKR